jgi:hypothetical protein
MSTRPVSPEQGPTSEQEVRAWLAGHPEAQARVDAEAEANRRLLRLFCASRPTEPSPDAWARSLRRIKWALLAGCAPPGNAWPWGHGC